MSQKIKTILVTGGYGFIGSHFIRHFLKNHPDFHVLNIDKLTYSANPDNLKDITSNKKLSRNYSFIKADIADQLKIESIFKKFKPDYLINFAAETHVDRSLHGHTADFINSNIYGVFSLLENIKRFGIQKAVFISTDEVYGSLDLKSKNKFTADSKLNPRSPYSASKAAGDLLCVSYYSSWKLPIIITRCCNNYGSRQFPEKLIPFLTTRALAGQGLPLYGNGENIRDWIYVLDHVEVLEKILFAGQDGKIYNIGANKEVSNLEMAKLILKVLKKPENLIRFIEDRPGHDKRYAIDFKATAKELDWRPRHKFGQSLKKTILWYVNNKSWIKKIHKKTKAINPHINL